MEGSGVGHLPAEHLAPHITLTRTIYRRIAADHVNPLVEMVFPDSCALFQQDIEP